MSSVDFEGLIQFENVWLKFPLAVRSRPWALCDLSFTINEGDAVGIVGSNGAGKSTLLRLAAGIMSPTRGDVRRKVTCHTMFGIGSGFQNELTGMENIRLYAAFMGISDVYLESRIGKIIDFSELGDAVDMPLFTYSRGMKARLGFSVVSELEPEFLILDEVFSAGDKDFRKKTNKRIRQISGNCKGVIMASHNENLISEMCNVGIWIERGEIKMFDSIERVTAARNEST